MSDDFGLLTDKEQAFVDSYTEKIRREERERIIALLEAHQRPIAASGDDLESFGFREGIRDAIALIKGENK